jgi:hypothetical protein
MIASLPYFSGSTDGTGVPQPIELQSGTLRPQPV